MSNIFKVNNKDTRMISGDSIVNFTQKISQTLNNNPSNIPKILVSNDRTSTELIEIANILNNFFTFNAA